MKSVQANNNYSGFSEVTTKHEVSNIRQPSGLSNSLCLYKYQTRLKSVFKMSSVCPGASSKTWSPLHAWPLHRWTLAGNVPSLRSDTTSAGRRHESACGRRSCSFRQIWQSTGLSSGLLAGHRAGVMKSGVPWVAWSHEPGRQAPSPVVSKTPYWKRIYFVIDV